MLLDEKAGVDADGDTDDEDVDKEKMKTAVMRICAGRMGPNSES